MIRYKLYNAIFLFLLTSLTLQGQGSEHFNELYKKLSGLSKGAKPDKVDSLWKLSAPFFTIGNDTIQGKLNYGWGNYHYKNYKYDSAGYFLKNAIDNFLETGKESEELGDAYYKLAVVRFEVEDISQAVELSLKALKIYENLDLKTSIARTYNFMANVYSYIAEYNLAISYYEQSLDIYRLQGDTADMVLVMGNLASLHATRKNYDLAMEYYNMGLEMLHEDTSQNALDYELGLGIVMEETKQYDQAEKHFVRSLEMARKRKDYIQSGYIYLNFAYLKLAQNKLDSVPYYTQKVEQIADKYEVIGIKAHIDEIMHEYYFKQGEYRTAYELLKRARAESDSFYDLDMTRQLQAVQAQYSTLKKEKELAQKNLELEKSANELKEEANLRNFLIAGILLFLLVVLVVLRNHRIKARANKLLLLKNQEIQEKNKEIIAVEEAKSRWFTNISHELRTPLTLIKGPVRQALDAIPVNDHIYKDLKIADRNISQLQNLVNEILDLSKMEDGKMDLKPSTTNLTEMVLNTLASFDNAARYAKVKLELDLDPEKPVFMDVDKSKIVKILNNLVSNALKFTSEGGKIVVGLENQEHHVVIKVADTGGGIDEADLERIFDRFYQTSNPKFSRQGGTGVGLALSKEIALLHQGDLKVKSEAGKGSCFELFLPTSLISESSTIDVENEEIRNIESESAVDAVNYSSVLKDKRILLVDDNTDMREYITGFLKQQFEVIQARDGTEGLEKLKLKTPDLIISDIMMPRMDGITFAREVKSNEKWKNIPFITVSAIVDETEKINTLRIGIDDYIVKPFNAEELQIRAQNLIYNYTERLNFKKEGKEEEISHDEKTLKILEKEVFDNINDTTFNVLRLAEAAAMSERQLYRYVRQHTGLTPANFIKEIRLQKAMDLLQKRVYNRTAQLSYAVGFQQPAYFSSVFRKRFGRLPNEYLEN